MSVSLSGKGEGEEGEEAGEEEGEGEGDRQGTVERGGGVVSPTHIFLVFEQACGRRKAAFLHISTP